MISDAEPAEDAGFMQALALFQQRRPDEAADLCRRVLEREPRHVHALNLSGVIALQTGQPALAAALLLEAIEIDPHMASIHYNRGNALCLLQRHDDAVACYDEAIALRPDYAEAQYNRGNALRSLGRHREAIRSYDAAISLRPDLTAAYYNRGNALRALEQHAEAIASYDHAIALRPDFAPAFRNRANAYGDLGNPLAAAADLERAVSLDPAFVDAWLNLGDTLMALRRFADAARAYGQVVTLAPEFAQAHASHGNALTECKDFSAALASYDRAVALNPGMRGIHGARLYAKMQACDWQDFAADLARLGARIARGEPATHPFCFLAMSGSPALQMKATRSWVESECRADGSVPVAPARASDGRIRVGYFSADFRNHPVARLTAELFEIHDRDRFEVTAFSFGPDTRDGMRLRLEQAFDRFIDLRGRPDREIAELAREIGIDIAIDLGGFTEFGRPGVFALRAAPVQVSYLGYLGTSAAPWMDYLIADPVLVPAADRGHYAERLIYLPSYQVNDSRRRLAGKDCSRLELGLPVGGCGFCCLNASYKIDPDTFGGWMRILARVQDSFLLLYPESGQAEANLRREAADRGIDPDRILFARRLPFEEYLARFSALDLFLDTLPYNAGATASDALWSGLPVLTRRGASFAGRIASSLLESVGLPELITATPQEYEDSAVALATDPERLAAVRSKLAANRLTAPLFDTRRFCASLEAAYVAIHRRCLMGRPPGDIRAAV